MSANFALPDGSPLVGEDKRLTLPWQQAMSRIYRIAQAMQMAGTTANRPTQGLWIGRFYFDTDLGEPVWVLSVNPTVWATAGGGGGGSGTVTLVSVATANGFAGTVATAATTPVITLTTSVTGLLKGNGTAVSAAAAGTDYVSSVTLTGDVTGTGTSSFAATIAAGAVTLAKQASLAANSIIGNNTGAAATPLALTATQVKTLLAVTATDVGLGNVTNDAQTKSAIVPNTAPAAGNLLVGNAGGTAYAPVAASGDVTAASTGAFTIGAGKVTYAKMQNVSATSRILGRVTAGAGSPEELTLSQTLDFVGSAANGDILTRQAGTWNRLAIGSTGQLLSVASGLPVWVTNEQMLANVTLGVAGTSLASGAITACRFLRIEIYIAGYAGSDTASLQFNATAGTGYRYRWLTSAAAAIVFTAGLNAVSTDRIKVAAVNTTSSRRVVALISNDSTVTEKMVTFSEATGTGSAATQATLDMGNGAWVSAAATQITSVSLISTSNLNVGTQMTIFGWN